MKTIKNDRNMKNPLQQTNQQTTLEQKQNTKNKSVKHIKNQQQTMSNNKKR